MEEHYLKLRRWDRMKPKVKKDRYTVLNYLQDVGLKRMSKYLDDVEGIV